MRPEYATMKRTSRLKGISDELSESRNGDHRRLSRDQDVIKMGTGKLMSGVVAPSIPPPIPAPQINGGEKGSGSCRSRP